MKEFKKEVFTLENKDQSNDKVTKTEYAVVTPKPVDGRKAQEAYNAAFAAALKSGGLLRQRLTAYMREQGLWNDEKETLQRNLIEKLSEHEIKLKKGGIKLNEARGVAMDMRQVRAELRRLISERNELDVNTVEGQAENARFNALVARCLVYNDTGKPVYSDADDYLTHGTDEVAYKGAQVLANLLYQVDDNYESSLPENQFLKRFKFIDDDLRFRNKEGNLVDEDGRLINEDGHYVDNEGNLVDINGNRVDDKGNYIVESQPFLDDDGNPIAEDSTEDAAGLPAQTE